MTVAEGSENEALYKREIELANVNFLNSYPLSAIRYPLTVFARVRYRQPLAKATLIFKKNSPRSSASSPRQSATLVFERAQKFIAPGQSAVFYDKNGTMLGGGVIV